MSLKRLLLLPMIAACVAAALWLLPERFPRPEVVVYTSVDQIHAKEIFIEFAAETGIDVRASYDVEAQKTTGLFQQIRNEASAPIADVFWNSEASRTEMLKREGLLQPYVPPSATDIPPSMRDPDGHWHGFAARARVIVYHQEKLSGQGIPRRLHDLLDPGLRGKVAIANPLFGTTGSHVAALFAAWGDDAARAYLDGLLENDVAVVAGNSTVRDLVARGELWAGLTDTDDVWVGIQNGYPIGMTLTDQADLGTLVIPNTVAMLRGCRHPEEARRFIDFLLGRRVERMLAESPSRNLPVRRGVPVPDGVVPLPGIRGMEVTIAEVVDAFPASEAYVRESFLAD